MEKLDLKTTKTKLAIVFTIIVFVIASFLEIIYFSLRYYNFSYNEQKEFRDISQKINSDISSYPLFLRLFLTQGINFKPPLEERLNGEKRKNGPEKGFRFMNFLVFNNSGKIVAQNLNQDFDMNLDLQGLKYNEIKKDDGIFIVKIDISYIGNDFKDLILFKKQAYNLEDYFKDLIFFFLINLIFSVLFFYIGLFFVGKNLRPVQDTLNDMNDFIHNANHELKTPISVINSNLGLLKETKIFEQDLIDDSINEIKRLDNLIKGLSNLSNITITSKTQTLDVQTEIQDIIQELTQNIQQKNINLQFDIIKNFKITANKEYFYIMFGNLLRNAIKYNFENGKIKIILDKNKIIISNTGETISSEDLPNIFQRFFKGEKARNSQGFGIGLSLVKKICDIYSWNILVSSDENETIFEVRV